MLRDLEALDSLQVSQAVRALRKENVIKVQALLDVLEDARNKIKALQVRLMELFPAETAEEAAAKATAPASPPVAPVSPSKSTVPSAETAAPEPHAKSSSSSSSSAGGHGTVPQARKAAHHKQAPQHGRRVEAVPVVEPLRPQRHGLDPRVHGIVEEPEDSDIRSPSDLALYQAPHAEPTGMEYDEYDDSVLGRPKKQRTETVLPLHEVEDDYLAKWRSLRLDPKFEVRETPNSFEILGFIPGLDPSDVRVKLSEDKMGLTVDGFRGPTPAEEEELEAAAHRQVTNQLRQMRQVPSFWKKVRSNLCCCRSLDVCCFVFGLIEVPCLP